MTARKVRPMIPPATPPAIPAILDAEEGVKYESSKKIIGVTMLFVELAAAEPVGGVVMEEVSPMGVGIRVEGTGLR